MADSKYRVKVGDAEYEVTAPDENTAWQWANMTHAQRAAAPAAAKPAPEEKEEGPGFIGSFVDRLATFGRAPEATKFALGEKGAREELVRQAEAEGGGTEFGLDKTLGENLEAFKEMAGGSLGFMAGPLAAGATASAFSGPAAPVVGPVVTALGLVGQYGIDNLTRQAQTQAQAIERGETPEETSVGKAAVAAAGQTGLDFVGFRLFRPLFSALPFTRNLFGAGGEEAAKKVVQAATQGKLSYTKGIASGVAGGVAFEIPQEVAQSVLERWQAGLDLSNEDARNEYTQAAIGAALLGGPMGGVSGGISTAKKRATAAKLAETREEAVDNSEAVATEFDNLLLADVIAEMQANPGMDRDTAFKQVVTRAPDIATRARANVEATQTQAEAGAGLGGGAGRPDVDVAGASGTSVPDTGDAAPTGEATQTASQAEPIGVAGAGEPIGNVAGAEAGADGALTPPTISLEPIKAAPNMAKRKEAARPLVTATIAELAPGVEVPTTIFNSIVNVVAQRVANNETFELKPFVETLLVRNKVELTPAPTPATGTPSYVVDNARATVDVLRQRNPAVLDTITDLHAQDKTAAEIATATKLDVDTVRDVRIGLGLPSQGKPSGGKTIFIPGDAEERAVFEAWRDNYNSGKMAATVSTPAPTTEAPSAVEEGTAPSQAEPVTVPEAAAPKLSPIEQAAVDLISAVDAGGVPFNTPKINAIAEKLGLEVSKKAKPEDTIQRIRDAVSRFTYTAPIAEAQAAPTVAETATVKSAPTQATPTEVEAELTPESLIAEIEQAVADGFITPALAASARTMVETNKTPLPTIKENLDRLINNETSRRMGIDETVTPTSAPETAVQAEAAPAETVEAEADILAPARGEMKMPDRKAAVSSVAERLVDAAIKGVKIPTGVGVKELSAIKKQVTNQISQRLAKAQAQGRPDEAVDASSMVDALLRSKGFAIPERTAAPAAPAAPQAAPAAAPAPAQAAPKKAAPKKAAPKKAAPTAAAPPPPPPPPPPPSGGPSAAPQPPKKPKPVKLTQAQITKARKAAGLIQAKANKMQKRVAATREARDVLSTGLDIAKLLRGDKTNLAILRAALDTLSTVGWRTLLPTLSTMDIFRILKERIPGLNKADRIIRDDITRYEAKEYTTLAKELEEVSKFLKKFPKAADVLSDLKFMTTAYQVDPSKARNAAEYIQNVDKLLAQYRNDLKNTTDAKKIAGLKKKITTRSNAIKAVYEGGNVNGTVVYGWKDLSSPEFGGGKGKQIFALMRDAHRRDLNRNYQAIRQRIIDTSGAADVQSRLDKLSEAFRPALDQVIYFPLMRDGSFYIRIGKGVESVFIMFESRAMRDRAYRQMKRIGEDVTEYGDVKDLRTAAENESNPLQELLQFFTDNPGANVDALKDEVFDLWLQSSVAGDMSKHLMKRESRAGYSTNILKNFANFRRKSLNHTKRAMYGYKLQQALASARASLTPDMDLAEREKMLAFVNEIDIRARAKLLPDTLNDTIFKQAIELGNKLAFYQYLANPKSGLIQLTQLHIVSLPLLSQKYGTAKAAATLAKYGFSSLGGFVASPLRAIKRVNGEFEFDWKQPNLLDNPATTLNRTSDPELFDLLSEGWKVGSEFNLFLDTFAQSVGNFGALDPTQRTGMQELMRGRVDTAALRGTKFVFNAMGSLMHQMERVNREATYMASLELAYRENRQKGMSHEDAKTKAIEEARALTMEATFDFSAYNKPRVFTEGVGKVAGQFYTYPYMMSSLLVRNLFTAMKTAKLPREERIAASQIAAGTLLNLALYAGLTGLPFYGIGKVIGYMLAELFDDDDEEGGMSYFDPETGELKATYDMDWWFRNVWIPEFFGPGGTVATMFGLTPEQAELTVLMADKGPISAVTDVDLANSVASSFFFFLPEESRADTLEGQMMETVFNVTLGASGSMLMDYAKAMRDLTNGYTDRALEKLPKVVSNPLKASRFADEGQRNYKEQLVGMDKEFWTTPKLIFQALGFASTAADRQVETAYRSQKVMGKGEKERTRVTDQFKRAVRLGALYGDTNETRKALDTAMQGVEEYSRTYVDDELDPITLNEMATNTIREMGDSEGRKGVPVNQKGEVPVFLQRELERRTARE
jgi:hypothetical protein